ncbi:MAG: MarR family winged helix-turn-helix transcriptional regulator [Candidatus Saccharibacteria bacterium]|nr:MarR family winged helix-turn-helix transcriptional regulator [Candidatus Saccharibacteria bacterium]
MADTIRLTKQQQRLLKLVYKFRFITAPSLAKLLSIRHDTAYESLQSLLKLELIERVYKQSWRIDRKPAYYYLSKQGVTTVKKLLELQDRAVNSIYNDFRASQDFIQECFNNLECYISIKQKLPEDTIIRTKTEINRFKIFPKQRPELYVKTASGHEAFIIIVPDKLPYFVNKRRDEYIEHSEEEGWRGAYPTMAFVFKDSRSKLGFLYKAQKKLEELGYEENEISIVATDLKQLTHGENPGWSNAFNPTKYVNLLS